MTEEERITRCSGDHRQHGEPHVRQGLRWKPAVPDAEHMRHGLEQGP